MTETAARIRWERIDGTVTSWFGYVGSHRAPVFQILHPVASKPDARTQFHKWALAATFAQDEVRYPETAEGAQAALKAEAEDWLAEFVSSLGAVFPGGHPDGNAIEAYCATGTGDGRHLLQYAVRLPDGTTTAYGDQPWVKAGLGARDHDGASTVVRDIWVSYGPWRTHETSAPVAGEE